MTDAVATWADTVQTAENVIALPFKWLAAKVGPPAPAIVTGTVVNAATGQMAPFPAVVATENAVTDSLGNLIPDFDLSDIFGFNLSDIFGSDSAPTGKTNLLPWLLVGSVALVGGFALAKRN